MRYSRVIVRDESTFKSKTLLPAYPGSLSLIYDASIMALRYRETGPEY
jgi:hypothetical protein